MKDKKVWLYIIIFLIIIVMGIDLALVITYKNKSYPKVESSLEPVETKRKINKKIVKQYNCNMPREVFTNEDVGITYTRIADYYTFLIAEDNTLFPNNYEIKIQFNNLEDLSKYYNYLIEDMKLSEQDNTKDEKALTITFASILLQGTTTTFDNSYLEYLAHRGYICNEGTININEGY